MHSIVLYSSTYFIFTYVHIQKYKNGARAPHIGQYEFNLNHFLIEHQVIFYVNIKLYTR